jgi:hypothetical protein
MRKTTKSALLDDWPSRLASITRKGDIPHGGKLPDGGNYSLSEAAEFHDSL